MYQCAHQKDLLAKWASKRGVVSYPVFVQLEVGMIELFAWHRCSPPASDGNSSRALGMLPVRGASAFHSPKGILLDTTLTLSYYMAVRSCRKLIFRTVEGAVSKRLTVRKLKGCRVKEEEPLPPIGGTREEIQRTLVETMRGILGGRITTKRAWRIAHACNAQLTLLNVMERLEDSSKKGARRKEASSRQPRQKTSGRDVSYKTVAGAALPRRASPTSSAAPPEKAGRARRIGFRWVN